MTALDRNTGLTKFPAAASTRLWRVLAKRTNRNPYGGLYARPTSSGRRRRPRSGLGDAAFIVPGGFAR